MIELTKSSILRPINELPKHGFSVLDDALVPIFHRLIKNLTIAGLTDCRAFMCTQRSIEQILDPWWGHILFHYFPYSYLERGSEHSKKELFLSLSIDSIIRKQSCFYETTNLVYVSYPRLFDDLDADLREVNAFTIYGGRLFHVGFGDQADFRQTSTTVDIHDYKNGFDLKKADKSIRFKGDDIISTFVSGNYIYFGSSNGNIVVVDYESSCVVDIIRCNKCAINNVCVYQGRVCYSDYEKKILTIRHSFGGEVVTKCMEFKDTIIALESDEKNFYCITADGTVATVNVEEGTVTRLQSIWRPISGKPLLKNGFLYTSHEKSLCVYNLKEDVTDYSNQFADCVSGLGVYKEFVFVGIVNRGIVVLDRSTGTYISKICDLSDHVLTGVFHFYKGLLYSYTDHGEILTVDLKRANDLSGYEMGARSLARTLSLAFRSGCYLNWP